MSQATTAPDIDQVATAYGESYAHLADELAWLDLLIQLRVAEMRLRALALSATGQQQIFIAHAEVDALLQPADAILDTPALADLRATIGELRSVIDGRVAATLAQGDDQPLARLGRVFGLSPFEQAVLLICLAPELERKYDRLYAYLQDDMTRKKPSVDLALNLLCDRPAERWQARSIFAEHAPLFRYGLLQASDDPQSPSGSSDLARFLKLDPRIAGFLLGDGRIDGRLAGIARLEWPDVSTATPLIDPALLARTLRLVEHHCIPGAGARQPLALHLRGAYGSGRWELALAICGQLPCPLLVIDTELLMARGGETEALLRTACREGPLCQAALYLNRVDILLGDEERARTALRLLASATAEYGWLIFLAGERPWPAQGLFEGMAFQSVTLPRADASLRAEAWRRELARSAPGADAAWVEELALRFRLTPGQIRAAAEDAAQQQVMNGMVLTLAELSAACRRQSSRRLADLAQPIAPHAGWDDLVLLPDCIAQLRELCGLGRAEQEHRRVPGRCAHTGRCGADRLPGHGLDDQQPLRLAAQPRQPRRVGAARRYRPRRADVLRRLRGAADGRHRGRLRWLGSALRARAAERRRRGHRRHDSPAPGGGRHGPAALRPPPAV